MTEVAEKICPYCQDKIESGDTMVQCSQCGVPHHKECWEENGGCTVYGCKGWALWPGLDLPPREERTFEPVDLTKMKTREFVLACPMCQARVKKGMSTCEMCGYELPQWMLGKYIVDVPWWVLVIISLVVLGGAGAAVYWFISNF